MIFESIGIFSINKNLFVGGIFLSCMLCLLSLRAAQSFISLRASSLFVFASIYYCIGLVAASFLCLVVCTIIDLACSPLIDYAQSVIAKSVESESSAATENFPLGPQIDDHLFKGASVAIRGAFKVSTLSPSLRILLALYMHYRHTDLTCLFVLPALPSRAWGGSAGCEWHAETI